jgi:hypothetical protein
MEYTSRNAVRQVLKEASEHHRFFDFSEAERLTWMIERAFVLGAQSVSGDASLRQRSRGREVHTRPSSAQAARGQGHRKA